MSSKTKTKQQAQNSNSKVQQHVFKPSPRKSPSKYLYDRDRLKEREPGIDRLGEGAKDKIRLVKDRKDSVITAHSNLNKSTSPSPDPTSYQTNQQLHSGVIKQNSKILSSARCTNIHQNSRNQLRGSVQNVSISDNIQLLKLASQTRNAQKNLRKGSQVDILKAKPLVSRSFSRGRANPSPGNNKTQNSSSHVGQQVFGHRTTNSVSNNPKVMQVNSLSNTKAGNLGKLKGSSGNVKFGSNLKKLISANSNQVHSGTIASNRVREPLRSAGDRSSVSGYFALKNSAGNIYLGNSQEAQSGIAYQGELDHASKELLQLDVMFKTHQYEKVISTAENFLAENTTKGGLLHKNPAFHFVLALSYYKIKNYEKARDHFKEVLTLKEKFKKSVFVFLGICLFNLKDYEEANKIFSRAIELFPKYSEAKVRTANNSSTWEKY